MVDFVLSVLRVAIPAGTPLLFGTLGEVYAERSGVLNLGIEGMMIMGAITGFGVTHATGNVWLGVVAAALVGGLLALLHAFTSVTLRVNQVVSGLGLTMLGLGLSGMLGKRYIGQPPAARLGAVTLPVLSDLPVLGSLFFRFDPLVYLAVILVPVLWFVLYKTRWGVTLRSVGENPAAADALGVNVVAVRYLAVFFGGVMAGLGGGHLSLAYTPAWIEGMTAGAGWIVIALTIFAMWDPARALVGAYLFGGVRVLQFRLQPLGISPNLLNMLPFILTILVLLLSAGETMRKRIGAPEALMQPYAREE
ncbi:simple sugar transport system permease protein [Candidatus Hakubella thermalkaliphila]|uniref:Simple sugar transport system permease protein n=1 Tax=Candidatus Hakubella thermalkaliphila TaxID=2754717 RepID=A0A6V8NNH1_9ACTN|nr:ABC transporter permease [Candidatus Hakubella thermalkaliphila]GFP20850.1 simple sugar transport system permease protein [Candidatus Hakubella thermalkaliphila]GFP40914.1 simple sugar transport system permease protein [Candidatus Hakubella thermalkaliphila]